MSARETLVRARGGEDAFAAPASWARPRRRPDRTTLLSFVRLAVTLASAAVFAGLSLVALLLAAVFFVCLQRSFRATRGALGAAVTAATGAVVALLATLPLIVWLHPLAALGTALAACAVLPPIERVARIGFARPPGVATVSGRVPPRQVTPDWIASLPPVRPRSISAFSKRAFDIAVATAGLVSTLPLWPALLLLSFRRDGGFLFRQLRVGEGGKLFTMMKLRTMRLDAELPGQAVWAQVSDPRVTFAGRFLRETHLDELPQLWNVLRGDMSIVGPRPERPELDLLLEDAVPHWKSRHVVKPGITGWAQVHLGYAGDCEGSEAKLSYDLWYLRHRSLMLDLAICLRTVPSLAPRRRAASQASLRAGA